MDLSKDEKQLIFDYFFYHIQSPLNTNAEDYRKFNTYTFRAIKLNFLYTLAFGMASYNLFFQKDWGILRGVVKPGLVAFGLFGYSCIMFARRFNNAIYNEEALECAKKYEKDVERYNDHYRRIYGNK
ncbi:unnamed protein product [Blepharisma stoltei]|uniref:Uncharacterized protein n=1 Tax=Blepharisma stoltei TaxID=1481888 RepID=A0AAU9KHY1_9CILI|nr:unnamed protein product [Blepharisma stoltei]